MKRAFLLLTLFVFISCTYKKNNQVLPKDKLSLQEKEITQTFREVDSILTHDNGALWGVQLYGPLLLVDPASKVFYSNENILTKDFKTMGSFYKDTLPTDINMANTALDWRGKRWSMVLLPLPNKNRTKNHLIIHELFHRIQPEIGFVNLQELDNGHLDTYQGRLLLKLELEALEKAIQTKDTNLRKTHIQNALVFRAKRQLTPEIQTAENSLELNEGLAEYTALMLSGRSLEEMRVHLIQSKDNFYPNPTFVRSFAYQTVPLYGYLLALKKQDWHREIDRNTNLTDYIIRSFGYGLYPDRSIEMMVEQNDYGYKAIKREEMEREKSKQERIAELEARFVHGPTLELEFQNMNISFDPNNIIPLKNHGMVYSNIRITDDWGILTVKGSGLLASDWSNIRVTLPNQISDEIVIGDDWELKLNSGWQVSRSGDKFQLKTVPLPIH